jgi:signal transduction histidine kinase
MISTAGRAAEDERDALRAPVAEEGPWNDEHLGWPADRAPVRILLVEDSPSDASLLEASLTQSNLGRFEFTHVECWAAALEQLQRRRFDVLLLDLFLPDSSGRETLLRAQEAAARLPIVVLTGVADEAIGLEAVRLGVQDYLTKSQANARQTARAIRYAIERKQAEETLRQTEAALRQSERELRELNLELEHRVALRTADLIAANTKLQAALSERRRLEQELLEITDKERRRIGLDLHDDLGQKLSGLALMTKGLELKLARRRSSEAREAARIHALAQETMSYARDLAKDLAALDSNKTGLAAVLNDLAAHVRDLFKISCRVTADDNLPALEPTVINQLYKIAQEAVTNAIKHGKAKRVNIHLANGAGNLVLTVHNTGLPLPDLKGHSKGMGMRIMKHRASLIGASLDISGAGQRGGTRVTCALPLETKK